MKLVKENGECIIKLDDRELYDLIDCLEDHDSIYSGTLAIIIKETFSVR